MRLKIEIRSAEGGDDAKQFALELADAYVRMFEAEG